MLMHAHDRAVDQSVFEVGLTGHGLEQPFENAFSYPAAKPFEHRVPVTELVRQITPGSAGSCHPKHRFDKKPIICRDPAISRFAR